MVPPRLAIQCILESPEQRFPSLVSITPRRLCGPNGSAVLTAHFTSTERLCFTRRLLCHPSPPNLPSPHPPYAQGQASFGQLGLREREGSSEADKSGFESWITFLATCPWSHCLDSRSPRLPTSKTRLTERRCEHEPEAAARAQARCEHRHKSATS